MGCRWRVGPQFHLFQLFSPLTPISTSALFPAKGTWLSANCRTLEQSPLEYPPKGVTPQVPQCLAFPKLRTAATMWPSKWEMFKTKKKERNTYPVWPLTLVLSDRLKAFTSQWGMSGGLLPTTSIDHEELLGLQGLATWPLGLASLPEEHFEVLSFHLSYSVQVREKCVIGADTVHFYLGFRWKRFPMPPVAIQNITGLQLLPVLLWLKLLRFCVNTSEHRVNVCMDVQ